MNLTSGLESHPLGFVSVIVGSCLSATVLSTCMMYRFSQLMPNVPTKPFGFDTVFENLDSIVSVLDSNEKERFSKDDFLQTMKKLNVPLDVSELVWESCVVDQQLTEIRRDASSRELGNLLDGSFLRRIM